MIKKNSFTAQPFVTLTIAWGAALTIATLSMPKGTEILWLNAHRSSFADAWFMLATKMGEEISFAVFTILALFVKFRYAILLPLIGGLATAASAFFKKIFAQPRPAKYFETLGRLDELMPIEGVELLIGNTSFPSGHTTAGFALFGFLAFIYMPNKWWQIACFAAAAMVGTSRMYLMHHFAIDVAAGSLLGLLLAGGVFVLQKRLSDATTKWFNKRILFRFSYEKVKKE